MSRRHQSLISRLNPFARTSVDRSMEFKRSRRPRVEQLEDRRMLAILIGANDDIEAINDNNVPNGQDIGHDQVVTLENFSLNADAGDSQDVFLYRANATGRLFVAGITVVGSGMTYDVQDRSGSSLLGGPVGLGVDRTIPVVQDEEYHIVIADPMMGDGSSFYSFEVKNTAAPTPASVSLSPASDTGASNSDGVTADNTPTFFIQDDLASFLPALPFGSNVGTIDSNGPNGYDVQLVATNLSTGAQTTVNATRLGTSAVWTATTPMLADGVYLIAAQTVVQDNYSGAAGGSNTGFSQLSIPIFVTIDAVADPVTGTIDLLQSADTGAFNSDNVTSTRTPAFTGVGPQNGIVRIFAQETNSTTGAPVGAPLLVASGTVGSDNTDGVAGDGQGRYQVTTIPIDDGLWLFTAQFEDTSGNLSDMIGLNGTLAGVPGAANIPDGGANNVGVGPIAAASFPGLASDVPIGFLPIIDVDATISITHPNADELDIFLSAPGPGVILSSDNGGGGANYTNTTFDDSASTPITAGVAPFTGLFRPEQALSAFNGLNALSTSFSFAVTDDTVNGVTGTFDVWALNISVPLPVVIDTIAPNQPLLDLTTASDTGRNNADNVTNDNMPTVSMTGLDSLVSGNQLLFQDNLQYRIYDRFGTVPEFLLYDTAADAAVENVSVPGDGLTSLTQITETLAAQFIAGNPANGAVLAGGLLADGVHELRLEVLDRAGNVSHSALLSLTVDTTVPPVSFGLVNTTNATDGIFDGSDTGTPVVAGTLNDRVTSDTTPTFWGRAEADSIVTLYLDSNGDGIIQTATDFFLGQTVAIPLDGNNAFAGGAWQITANTDLNSQAILNALGLPAGSRDGFRPLLVTAQDVAGNPVPVAGAISAGVGAAAGTGLDTLGIFVDTQGPQITGVGIPDNPATTADESLFDLFDLKPTTTGYTPLITQLTLQVRDLPFRVDQVGTVNDFLYTALIEQIAETVGNYSLVGDRVGTIAITSVDAVNITPVGGAAASATITLTFAQPLPDDRFTLTVKDAIIDPAGNHLDGESNASAPIESPAFPSGDGVPGGNFVARFTVDSRPEIGTYIPTTIGIDINGNYSWDPNPSALGGDVTNVDITFTMDVANDAPGGYASHDLVFAGRFVANGTLAPPNIFDQLAVYGFSYETGTRRWLVDFNSDGVVDPSVGEILSVQPDLVGFNVAGAVPIAGNFDGNLANGDEIGLYNAGNWGFDFNRNFRIDANELVLNTGLLGMPIIGDFDGNGFDDVAVYRNDAFTFAFSFGAFGAFGAARPVLNWGFPGVLDRPISADMNQDGIDDIGLWVPRNSIQDPQVRSEWFFLVSDPGVAGAAGGPLANFLESFSPPPFAGGNDIYANFGDELSMPIVGNFDPPVANDGAGNVDPSTTSPIAGDYDGNGYVDAGDYQIWRSQFGQVGSGLTSDGNANGRVDSADYTIWRDNLGAGEMPIAMLASQQGDYDHNGTVDAGDYTVWRQQFGSTGYGLTADGNGDGRVDSSDYTVWRDSLGQVSAMATANSSLASASLLLAGPESSGPASGTPATPSAASTVGPLLVSSTATSPVSAGLATRSRDAVDAAIVETQKSLLLLDAALAFTGEGNATDDSFDLFDIVASGDETDADWWLPEL